MSEDNQRDDSGRALGDAATFVQDGNVYTLSGLTYQVRERYADYLYSQSLKSLCDLAGKGLITDLDRAVVHLVNDKSAGKFRWGGEVAISSLSDDANRSMFLFLQLQAKHPEVKLKTVREWMDREAEKLYRLAIQASDDPTTASSTPAPAA